MRAGHTRRRNEPNDTCVRVEPETRCAATRVVCVIPCVSCVCGLHRRRAHLREQRTHGPRSERAPRRARRSAASCAIRLLPAPLSCRCTGSSRRSSRRRRRSGSWRRSGSGACLARSLALRAACVARRCALSRRRRQWVFAVARQVHHLRCRAGRRLRVQQHVGKARVVHRCVDQLNGQRRGHGTAPRLAHAQRARQLQRARQQRVHRGGRSARAGCVARHVIHAPGADVCNEGPDRRCQPRAGRACTRATAALS